MFTGPAPCGPLIASPLAYLCSCVSTSDQHAGGGGGGGGDQRGVGGVDGPVCASHRVSPPLLGPAAALSPEIGT